MDKGAIQQMKIVGIFLNNEIRTGGHKRYLELMEGLAKSGNTVTVFLNNTLVYTPDFFSAIRLPVNYMHGKVLSLSAKFLSSIKSWQYENHFPEIDWIVIFGERHWRSAKFISEKTGARILFAYRSNSVLENTIQRKNERMHLLQWIISLLKLRIDIGLEKKIARSASLIAFQSTFDAEDYCSRNPGATPKTIVIRGDIKQPRFKPEWANSNKSTRCLRLLFVGTFGYRKGLRYLLEAMALVQSQGIQDLRLDILAAGKECDLFKKMVVQYGLTDFVTFHGKVAEPLPYMANADLMVVPSLFDSYPNVILEALHVGLPVIASKTGGIPDMLRDDRLLFDPASAPAIALHLTKIASNPHYYLEIRDLCSERRDFFDFDWAGEWASKMEQEDPKSVLL